MIKLQIVGHLGKDCVTREANGKNVIGFTVAHSERFKDSQGVQKEKTTWVDCSYWTERTGIAPYLKKGQLVYAEGFPEVDGYINKDNQPAATLKMRVMNIQLLGSKPDGQQTQQNASQQQNPAMAGASALSEARMSDVAEPSDDLPF